MRGASFARGAALLGLVILLIALTGRAVPAQGAAQSPSADLRISQTDSPDPALSGVPVTYTITFANDGPDIALNVKVRDTLPPGVTFHSVTPGLPECPGPVAGIIECSFGDMAVGASRTMRVVVSSPTNGTITNRVQVSSDTLDFDQDDNRSQETTAISASADVAISKAGPTGSVRIGDAFTYLLTVRNNGPHDATNVLVTDQLPANLSYVSSSNPRGGCTQGPPVRCALGGLPVSDQVDLTITVRAQADGAFVNRATVTADEADPSAANNEATATTVVAPAAALALSGSITTSPARAGQPLTRHLAVTNSGPSTATSVTISQPLPGGVELVSATASQGTCSGTSTVSCAVGTLINGGSATADIVVRPVAAGPLTLTATVAAAEQDPDTGNNSNTATVTVEAVADLSLTKTAAPTSVLAGQPVEYTLTVRNAGPSPAGTLTITDPLPAGVNLLSAQVSPSGSCSGVAPVTCTLPGLAAGGTATVLLRVVAPATGPLTNTATVSAAEYDPNPSNNNSGPVTVTVNPAADIQVTAVDTPDPANPGQPVTYQLTVTNQGPSAATAVSLTTVLPPGSAATSVSSSAGSCSGTTTIICALGNLAAAGQAMVTVVLPAPTVSPLVSTVTATAAEADPNPSNNATTVSTTVTSPTSADLALTLAANPSTAAVDQTVTATLSVTNGGPSPATAVATSLPLPASWTLLGATSSQGSCVLNSSALGCALGGLANGAAATVTVQLRAAPPAGSSSGLVTLAASVTATEPDPVATNNSATATVTIDAAVDLSVSMAAAPQPAYAGQPLTFTIDTANRAAIAATSVQVTVDLPSGVSLISATATPGTCSGAVTITCSAGTLAAGASARVAVQVRPAAEGPLTVTARASSAQAESTPNDNTSTLATTIVAAADLGVTLGGSPNPVATGDPLTYLATVTNSGPSAAQAATLSLTLPLAATAAPVAAQGSCTGTVTISCALGTLASGASTTVSVAVSPQTAGEVTATATVSSAIFDAVTANNTAQSRVTVCARGSCPTGGSGADLALALTAAPNPVQVGQVLTHTLTVTNLGPGAATNVRVSNPVPSGAVLVSATAAAGTCSGTTTVECTLGTLAAGTSTTASIVLRPAAAGNLVDTASVSAAEADANPANNSASVSTRVITEPPPPPPPCTGRSCTSLPRADLQLTKSTGQPVVRSGDTVRYELSVTNLGPDEAADVIVEDRLPEGLRFVSATPNQGRCLGTSVITCALGSLAAGQSTLLALEATVTGGGVITNTAMVTSAAADANPDNNQASATITVQGEPPPPCAGRTCGGAATGADLAVTLRAGRLLPLAGSPSAVSVAVVNNGPAAATGVSVSLAIPSGVTVTSLTTPRGSCVTTGTVACTIGGLAAGEALTLTLVVQPATAGPFTLGATVTAVEADPTPANNSNTLTLTVGG